MTGRGAPKTAHKIDFPLLTEVPEIPVYIEDDELAERVFERVCQSLIDGGVLSEIHIDEVAKYADQVSLYAECRRRVREAGLMTENEKSGGRKSHPLLNTMATCIASAIKIGQKFGLYPPDADKVRKNSVRQKTELDDILD